MYKIIDHVILHFTLCSEFLIISCENVRFVVTLHYYHVKHDKPT